jgi:hypothetical protein
MEKAHFGVMTMTATDKVSDVNVTWKSGVRIASMVPQSTAAVQVSGEAVIRRQRWPQVYVGAVGDASHAEER